MVDSGTDRVYQYSFPAPCSSGSQPAAASFALAASNANPQGIADPPAPNASEFVGRSIIGVARNIVDDLDVEHSFRGIRRHSAALSLRQISLKVGDTSPAAIQAHVVSARELVFDVFGNEQCSKAANHRLHFVVDGEEAQLNPVQLMANHQTVDETLEAVVAMAF